MPSESPVESLLAAEIIKLREAKFIREEQYPMWLTNIVPVKKKMANYASVDFRDLNKACPKEACPLRLLDLLLDNVVGHRMFSFISGFRRHNQFRMALEDEEKTTFYTHIGVFGCTIMPFGLNNGDATYQ